MHAVVDDFANPALIRSLLATWDAVGPAYWHVYDNGKRATKDPARLPVVANSLLHQMATVPIDTFLGVHATWPDLQYLHGAGMHEMPIGGSLGLHLDSERHPALPWKREASAVLYLEDVDGGELELCNEAHAVTDRIAAKANRLVLFATPGQLHRVAECRSVRRSLCLFFWSNNEGGVATTATFM